MGYWCRGRGCPENLRASNSQFLNMEEQVPEKRGLRITTWNGKSSRIDGDLENGFGTNVE